MAGIYLHIPFCKQACHYCNFHFTTSLLRKNELVSALLEEMELQKDYLGGETVETIYFGGGTPSLLDTCDCRVLLEKLRNIFPVSADAEITLEANPDDITKEKLAGWKETGINRLSIGIQSFFDEDLVWMNRAHTAAEAVNSLQLALENFQNITIDLIYGLPGLTNERWKKNVDMAINLRIPHLSCYALTVEPKTPLKKLIGLGKVPDVDPGRQSEQFLLLMEWMEEAGYEHYEISNFAKPGFRSLHNSSYWQGKKYLGLGPSAHSYDLNSRQWNIPNNLSYIDAVRKKTLAVEKEILTPTQKINEYIMTSLRTMEGLDLKMIGDRKPGMEKKIEKFESRGLLKNEGDHLVLTREGKLFADGIAGELFFTGDGPRGASNVKR